MGASHFFVGLGAGIAILTVPVLTLAPGMDLPHRFATWIDGPQQHAAQAGTTGVAISRPTSGYKPGDPTPAPDAPPTIEPPLRPTPVPVAVLQPAFVQPPPSGASMRTGVIRAGGAPVFVRRAAGVESTNDAQLADGAPVLVSAGGSLQIGGQPWRAVRGLSGVVGWVLSAQVQVDGEAPPVMVAASNAPTPSAGTSNAGAAVTVAGARTASRGPAPIAGSITIGGAPPIAAANGGLAAGTGERMRVANTDGVGVVLRNSPRDADKSTRGLMDGANVSVLERNGAAWVHVRADTGQDGWIPTQYVVPAS